MYEPATLVTVALSATFGISVFSAAALKGWQGWLELKRLELGRQSGSACSPSARIDMSDLKERVRKLEAIANGDF